MSEENGREYVQFLNMRKVTEKAESLARVEQFFDDSVTLTDKNYMKEVKLLATNNVLTNLLIGHTNDLAVAYNRSHNSYYRVPKRYGMDHFTHRIVIDITDNMISGGFIENKAGTYYSYDSLKDKRKVSEMLPTEKLIDWFDGANNESWGTTNRQFKDPIILKDKENSYHIKKLVDYKESQNTKTCRQEMEEYNEFISSILLCTNQALGGIRADQTPATSRAAVPAFSSPYSKTLLSIPKLDSRLHRIWNNKNWDHGGRFYGADYQQLNEQERAILTIDGSPVVELDYSALHLRMLYHLEGKDFTGDPYQAVAAGNPNIRKLLKIICLVGINAASPVQALIAVERNKDAKPLIEKFEKSGKKLEGLLDSFKKVHHPIASKLYSGAGIELQNKDSKIAADILSHFTKRSIPCLCVHDSFIVPQQHKGELWNAMMEMYAKHMGGFSPIVK